MRAGRIAGVLGVVAMVASVGVRPVVQAAPAHAAVTLTMWSGLSGPDQSGFKTIIDNFNKSQSAVHINYDQQSYTGYATKLTTALSAGKGPNIWTDCAACAVGNENQGQLADLSKYIKSSKVLKPSNFPKGIWNQGKWTGGKFYLIPLDTVPLMLYYNKALLKAAGYKKPVLSPPSAVLKAAIKLTKGTDQYGLVIPTDWPMQFVWPTVFAQFGGTAQYDPKTKKSLVNSKAGVAALTYLYNLIYKYHTGPNKYAVDQNVKMLGNGSAAQMFDGSWQYTHPTLQTLGPNEGVSAVPQMGPKKKVFVGDLYFMDYKKDTPAQIKASIKFFEYFEAHFLPMAKVGDVPTYKPIFNSPALKKLPDASAAASELKYGVFSVRTVGYDDHWLYDDALWPVLRGQTTDIKGSLDKAAAAITAHMQGGSGA